jgi:predicted nucleic acid-binding protein
MRILVDTNVILDIALKREPFYESSSRILRASDFDRTHLFITAPIATDLHYILSREKGRETASAFIADLLVVVDVCGVDKSVLLEAAGSDFADFEDAVQNFAAAHNDIDVIVTRNAADFAGSTLTVLSPRELAEQHL